MLVTEDDFITKIASQVKKRLNIEKFDMLDARSILFDTYKEIFRDKVVDELESLAEKANIKNKRQLLKIGTIHGAMDALDFSNRICSNGYLRTKHTSSLVHTFMSSIKVELNEKEPVLSKVFLEPKTQKQVEVLKIYTYETVINSPRLKVVESRGFDIVKDIFEALNNDRRAGYNLLPQDFRSLYEGFKAAPLKKRVVCDFIAGMTDRYAVEFHSRLTSENPMTIFKPF